MTEIVRISKTELEGLALAAAAKAVQECQASFMATMGLNIANSNDVRDFQATIRFAENLRSGSTKVGARIVMTVIVVVVGAVALSALDWFKALFHFAK